MMKGRTQTLGLHREGWFMAHHDACDIALGSRWRADAMGEWQLASRRPRLGGQTAVGRLGGQRRALMLSMCGDHMTYLVD